MNHGIDAYFLEIDRFRRRLALIGIVVVAVFLGAEWWARRPDIVAALNDPKRFGFEGPEQLVEHIRLEQMGDVEQRGADVVSVAAEPKLRGGGHHRPSKEGMHPASEAPRAGSGPGADDVDLDARLRALALQGPVIRSEDLIVDKLVRPDYPEEARSKDIEGVVEMVALVDTTGAVTEVHIIGGSHQPLLEQAASEAVLQCRYRPYRVDKSLEKVWAFYRISFRLF